MELAIVGAGVGRTGTHCLKVALEKLWTRRVTTCSRSSATNPDPSVDRRHRRPARRLVSDALRLPGDH
jgi:hypothetical protein